MGLGGGGSTRTYGGGRGGRGVAGGGGGGRGFMRPPIKLAAWSWSWSVVTTDVVPRTANTMNPKKQHGIRT